MRAYRALLDVPLGTLRRVTGWLAAHRRRLGTRTGRRAATCRGQTLLVLRWCRDRTDVAALARNAGSSVSTGYRYLPDGIDGLAARAPDLPGLLAERRAAGPGYAGQALHPWHGSALLARCPSRRPPGFGRPRPPSPALNRQYG